MAEDSGNPFEQFSEDIQQAVDGLIWLGHLDREIEFCGHTFVIRTLKTDEELNAGLITKEYVETLGQPRAWATAKVALSLVSVDGDDNFCPPIGPDKKNFARARFNYVKGQWYWPIIEYLFAQYTDLERQQLEAIRALADLSQRSLPSFSPSPDSSTAPDDSNETTTETSTPSNTGS